MSCYQVDKFLRDINHDRALAERWRAECGVGTLRSPSDERETLAAWHVRKLYGMGAIEVGKVTHEIRDAVSWCRIFAFTLT